MKHSTTRLASAVMIAAFALLMGVSAEAKTHNVDVITMNPVTDGGRYMTVHDSYTLPQWSFNAGATFDYGFEPFEVAVAGVRRTGIINDMIVTNIQGAIGWTDWWTMGVNMPIAMFTTFYDPNVLNPPKQKLYGKLGDARVEMKFRILDISRYHVGLSVIPFMYFPTGDSNHFLGNGMWSPGGKIAFDADIKNRVFLAFNAGFRKYNSIRYDALDPNAILKNSIMLSGGINVRITDSWAVLGEIWDESVISGFFKNQRQNQVEGIAGGRFTPQNMAKGLGVTLMAGRGITSAPGSPKFYVLAGVNYRHLHTPPPPPPVNVEAQVEEKIIITQKIHFEFNRAVIRPISYPIVDDVADLLKRNPQIRHVRVEGHTDWIGGDAYNQRLSEKRARAVRDYLIQKGIEPDRLEAVGYGKSRPIADNNTVQGRARNRRTEFTVVQ